MNMFKYSTLALAVLASACGAVSNGGATGDETPTPTPGAGASVADIQKGNVAESANVTLEGLVVFAVKVGGSGVDFWAQDAGGGAQSGIYFFDQNGATPADLAVGDEVTVKGIYKEFYELSEITVTEVEITNNGLTPVADAVALSDLSDPANAEVWEGCLVEVTGTDLTVGGAVNNYGEFPLSNGSDTLMVDDLLYDATEGLSSGAAISYIAGVSHYAFEERKLLVRDAADLESEIVPVAPLTVADLQNPTLGNVPPLGSLVTIENVTIAAIYETGTGADLRRSFWAQQGSGPYSGLLVYDQDKTKPVIAVGDVVSLTDVKYAEFYDHTQVELKAASVIADVSSADPVEITTVSLAALIASPEQYESVLVSLDDASITVESLNPDGASDYGEYTITDGTNDIRVNDLMFQTRTGKTVSQALTTRIGFVRYGNGAFKLEPRSAADMQ